MITIYIIHVCDFYHKAVTLAIYIQLPLLLEAIVPISFESLSALATTPFSFKKGKHITLHCFETEADIALGNLAMFLDTC
jgi:hypothetical protein